MEKRFHCHHCGKKIGKTLLFQHKKLYYSSSSNTWQKDMDTTVRHSVTDRMESEKFHFSDEESNGAGTNWGVYVQFSLLTWTSFLCACYNYRYPTK